MTKLTNKQIEEYAGNIVMMATKEINGYMTTSWRTKDNKHFFLAPAGFDINNIRKFGFNLRTCEVYLRSTRIHKHDNRLSQRRRRTAAS